MHPSWTPAFRFHPARLRMVVAIGVSPYATSLPLCSGPFCCLLLDLDVDLGPWLFIGAKSRTQRGQGCTTWVEESGKSHQLAWRKLPKEREDVVPITRQWRAIPVPSTSSGRTSYTYRSTGHIRGFSAERQPKSATRASESGLMVWRSLVTKTSTCSHCSHFLLDFVPDFCKANVMSICGTPISPEN